jgi:superfamily II DNA/RNA helicase
MNFADLGLSKEVLDAVLDAGYTAATPIQEKAIPVVLMGRDILGCAQTGTGKTASFTLPMIDILANGRSRSRMPRALILEPTRELAAQVAENFDTYGKYNKLSKALIIGGASMDKQNKLLDRGVDVLIATPGRLLDLFERGGLLLSDVKILVIDEADRMLDMGFIPDVEKIVSVIPKIRQTLFFSATMPPEIKRLADMFLINPKEISISPPSTLGNTISQGLLLISHNNKRDLAGLQKKKRTALRQLIKQENVKNALVFCNRKKDVDILNKSFRKHGYSSANLHGDMVQSARMKTMEEFKAHKYDFLICSDVAARGLDIDELSHVFNFDIPIHPEDYVHRIGRTGRAGKQGRALSLAWKEDQKFVKAIELLTGKEIPIIKIEALETVPQSREVTGDQTIKTTTDKVSAKNNKKHLTENENRTADKSTKTNEKNGPKRRRTTKEVEKKPGSTKTKNSDSEAEINDGWDSHMPAFLMRPLN